MILSERQWGTAREDSSQDGNARDYFTHDMPRCRAYHCGEDGLAGVSHDNQLFSFSVTLGNVKDPILKGRAFGLTSSEANHGEDLKIAFATSASGSSRRIKAIRLLGMANIITLLFLSIASGTAAAQSTKVKGIIKSRSGPDIILSTSQDPNMIVMLTDSTDVGQVEGLLKARSKQMSMAALIPGLTVSAEGDYNNQNVLVASKVRFKGNDLKDAKAIAAGMHDTNQQVQMNKEELAKHHAELQAQNEALQKHQQAIAANKTAIDAGIARFGQLDDYYIIDQVSIYFANGKTEVDPKYISQVTRLAQNANKVDGYMIEVKGYASTTGSAQVNQKLSRERAQNVCDMLLQQGKVPLTRMLAPGAMGESEQVGTDKTVEGQAANRRVVVRVLQNKAIAGAPAA